MKTGLSLMAAAMAALLFATGCSAQTPAEESAEETEIVLQIGDPMMRVNGAAREIDPGRQTAPVIEDGRTLLPVRAVVEAMGGAVAWEEETQTVILAKDAAVLLLTIGSNTAFVNEEKHTLDTSPVVIDGRTMLPIRFIAEELGFEVRWDEENSTITIKNKA